jgi:ubiquinone biosynthesis protein UbiJ
MATRKMTFSLPEALARELVKRVPARQRSRYVAGALARELLERDRLLAQAADAANRIGEVRALERESDALQDKLAEPWDDDQAR